MPVTSIRARRDTGLTVLELLIVVAILAIVAAIATWAVAQARRAAREAAAIGNLKTVAAAEMTLYARKLRFGVLGELYADGLLVAHQFSRRGSGGGSEVVGDGTYEYSIRFTRDAAGITIDADPAMAYRSTHRRFRYRLGRRAQGGASGSEGVLLVAPPSVASPPARAYKPFK